jgi:hypothetical protein
MKAIQFKTKFQAGKILKLGLFSDLHIDSPDCDIDLLKRDLDICKKEGRYILIGGDIFDAIIHSDKKRYTPSTNINNRDDQINVKLEKVIETLKPYADNIIFISRGNHEESILKYSSTDILDLLIKELNHYKKNGEIVKGNYQNFIRFAFVDARSQISASYDIFQHHGAGGSAPITKGALDFNRLIHGTMADLVFIGHKHHSNIVYSDPIMYTDLNGSVKIKNRQAIMTPSYLKGRQLDDHNIHYAERFYMLQSLAGFGILDLIPSRADGKYSIKSDLSLKINPYAKIGDMNNLTLELIKKKVNAVNNKER